MAPLVRTGGSRHTGLAALPHHNIQDKIESAVYNAFYRQRSTVGTSVFEGKQIFKNPGVKKTGYRIFLFVLYSSRQNSNYDGKTI